MVPRRFEAPKYRQWNAVPTSKKIQAILVPLALDRRSEHQLLAAAALAFQLGAELVLLHFYQDKTYAPAHTTPSQYDHWNAALRRTAEQETMAFKARFEHIPEVRDARVIIHGGCVESHIAGVVEELRPDLILVSSHANSGFKRLLLGSKAELVMRHANCPVLVIPSSRNDG